MSSWADPEFIRTGWHPPGLPAGRRLDFCAGHFELVELNSSFYALPQPTQAQRWAEQTPAGFVMDVKCHRLPSRHATTRLNTAGARPLCDDLPGVPFKICQGA